MTAIDVQQPRVRPSRWWYLLVPLAIVLGVAGSIRAGIDEFGHIDERFQRAKHNGIVSIDLRQGEDASIWMLYEDGTPTDQMSNDGGAITVLGPHATTVEVDRPGARTTFSFGSLGGIRAGDFEAPEDGTYQVFAKPSRGATDVAVGNFDVGGAVMRTVRPGLLGMLAAIVLVIALIVMRGRAKRAIESAPQFQQPPLGVPGAPQTPVAPQGPVAPPQGPISYE
jgi:hypothetical protein